MKLPEVLAIWLLTAVVAVSCYPAQPDDEVEFIPLGARKSRPVLTDIYGQDGDDIFSSNPFGFLQSMQELMARLRQQMAVLLSRIPDTVEGEDGQVGLPGIGFPGIGDIDLSKGNTTSVTKVIDGHKVTINETTYENGGANGGAFFKVRVIDVKPDGVETQPPKETPTTDANVREVEPVEESIENEIPKIKEGARYRDIERFDDDYYDDKETWDELEPVGPFEGNSLDGEEVAYRDLSDDIYVNQLMADAGAPINPDAEFIDLENKAYSSARSGTIR